VPNVAVVVVDDAIVAAEWMDLFGETIAVIPMAVDAADTASSVFVVSVVAEAHVDDGVVVIWMCDLRKRRNMH
jgi:hypothetical protein